MGMENGIQEPLPGLLEEENIETKENVETVSPPQSIEKSEDGTFVPFLNGELPDGENPNYPSEDHYGRQDISQNQEDELTSNLTILKRGKDTSNIEIEFREKLYSHIKKIYAEINEKTKINFLRIYPSIHAFLDICNPSPFVKGYKGYPRSYSKGPSQFLEEIIYTGSGYYWKMIKETNEGREDKWIIKRINEPEE